MNKQIKIRYSKYYFGRDVFLLEINNKFLMVYRSSGKSGTGHGGEILPFMFLISEPRFREIPGFINKDMYYNSEFISHRKNLKSFPEAQELMNYLKEYLKDVYSEVIEVPHSRENVLKEAREINESIREIIGENIKGKLLDLKILM